MRPLLIRALSDCHGLLKYIGSAMDKLPVPDMIVQLGDLGFTQEWKAVDRFMDPERFRVVAGNHDDYDTLMGMDCALVGYGFLLDPPPRSGSSSAWKEDFWWARDKVAYLSGAYSIDKERRREGHSWWSKEELSWVELQDAVEWWDREGAGVSLMLTHCAPAEWNVHYYQRILGDTCYPASRTERALDSIWEISRGRNQNLTWIFGHHHVSKTIQLFDTKFVCLDEGEPYDIWIHP
jgi:hypothetical protein